MAAGDHVGHLGAIVRLEDETHALRTAAPAQRALLALRLYRHLAAFVGENLLRMQVEETCWRRLAQAIGLQP